MELWTGFSKKDDQKVNLNAGCLTPIRLDIVILQDGFLKILSKN